MTDEEFRRDAIAAINALRRWNLRMESRLLALTALAQAALRQCPPDRLAALEEEYDAEMDHHLAQIEPQHQQPQHWQEWSTLIASLRARHHPPAGPGAG